MAPYSCRSHVVGVNPLHAMFFDDPEQASPYSPASRLFLNILNIDPSRIPGFAACAEAREICASADHQRELVALRARRHVGYRRAARVKDRLPVIFASVLERSVMQYGITHSFPPKSMRSAAPGAV